MALCRLCLSNDAFLNDLSDIREGLCISVLVMIICPIKIESTDSFPKLICDDCLEVILSAYKLRDLSSENDRIMRTSSSIKLEIKQEHENNKEEEHLLYDSFETEPILKEYPKNGLLKKYNKTVSGSIMASQSHLSKKVHNVEAFPDIKKNANVGFSCDLCGNIERNKRNLKIHMINRHIIKETNLKVNLIRHSRESTAWNYFGALENQNGKIIDNIHFYCMVCVESEKYHYRFKTNRPTTVFLRHLEKIHNIYNELKPITKEKPIKCETVEYADAGSYKIKLVRATETGSVAWNYIGRLSDRCNGNVLIANRWFCKLCVLKGNIETTWKDSITTSCLWRHLSHHHKIRQPNCNGASRSEIKAICTVCGKELMNKYTLENHMRLHDNIEYPCSLCPARFHSLKSITRHLKIHDPKRKDRFRCDTCNAKFCEKRNLKYHLKNAHSGLKRDKTFACSHCDQKFYTSKATKQHVLRKHTGMVKLLLQYFFKQKVRLFFF